MATSGTKPCETLDEAAIDRLIDGVEQALEDAGIDPDGRAFAALRKLILDDVAWYLDRGRLPGDDASTD